LSLLATRSQGCRLLVGYRRYSRDGGSKAVEEALSELVVLKNRVHDPSPFLGHLYVAALKEWAERLSVHPGKLNKIVTIREAISSPYLH
jgi:hypothetical protein